MLFLLECWISSCLYQDSIFVLAVLFVNISYIFSTPSQKVSNKRQAGCCICKCFICFFLSSGAVPDCVSKQSGCKRELMHLVYSFNNQSCSMNPFDRIPIRQCQCGFACSTVGLCDGCAEKRAAVEYYIKPCQCFTKANIHCIKSAISSIRGRSECVKNQR